MNYRNLFEGIESPVRRIDRQWTIPINFDNAATTPPFKYVNETVQNNISRYSSIGRGSGQKSDWCTEKFEACRQEILKFFNLGDRKDYTVIYTKNATEGINVLAHALIHHKTDKVLTTRMEHHANDLIWRECATVEYVEVDEYGRLKMEELVDKLIKNRGRIKYVTVTGASNVTGYINPIHDIARVAHRYGAKIIVDAAQLVAHKRINMAGVVPEEAIDFLVFSAHKMYAPYGAGAIVGLVDPLTGKIPTIVGGGCVEKVLDEEIVWKRPPYLYEGGTQNFLGVTAMVAAMRQINDIGYNQIVNHEKILRDYLLGELKLNKEVDLYGDSEYIHDRLGIIIFNIKGIEHDKVANQLADYFGIATRYGKFCAHPYVDRLLQRSGCQDHQDGMVRLSLGLYNTLEEAEYLVEALQYLNKR